MMPDRDDPHLPRMTSILRCYHVNQEVVLYNLLYLPKIFPLVNYKVTMEDNSLIFCKSVILIKTEMSHQRKGRLTNKWYKTTGDLTLHYKISFGTNQYTSK